MTAVLGRAASALRTGGRLVYSHEHPVITSFEAREPDARRGSWTVDDYFVPGERDVTFLGRRVLKYHRTVEQHLDAIRHTGLEFARLRLCPPVRQLFGEPIPYFRSRIAFSTSAWRRWSASSSSRSPARSVMKGW